MNQEQQPAQLTETAMRQAIRTTLHTATRPANGRLSQLIPPIPPYKKRGVWVRHLAAVAVLLIILLGSFGMQQWDGNTAVWGHPSPTHQVSTATMTNAPTATQTAVPVPTPIATHANPSSVTVPATPPITLAPQPSAIHD